MPERVFAVRVDVAIEDAGRWKVRMRQRPSEGLLGGMWEFPADEVEQGEAAGGSVEGEALAPVTHLFSHFRAEYQPVVRVHREAVVEVEGTERWIDADEIELLALPVAQQKIADLLRELLREGEDGGA